jgi:hypothetical protein
LERATDAKAEANMAAAIPARPTIDERFANFAKELEVDRLEIDSLQKRITALGLMNATCAPRPISNSD